MTIVKRGTSLSGISCSFGELSGLVIVFKLVQFSPQSKKTIRFSEICSYCSYRFLLLFSSSADLVNKAHSVWTRKRRRRKKDEAEFRLI